MLLICLTGPEYRFFRFLVANHWDRGGRLNVSMVAEQDRQTLTRFERFGIIQNLGTLVSPHILVTRVGWQFLAEANILELREKGSGQPRYGWQDIEDLPPVTLPDDGTA